MCERRKYAEAHGVAHGRAAGHGWAVATSSFVKEGSHPNATFTFIHGTMHLSFENNLDTKHGMLL